MSQAVTQDFYADPGIYDILHALGTGAEVDALLGLCRRFLRAGSGARRTHAPGPPWTFLEPACGTGRYLRALAKRGQRVVGFDREAGMVEYAAARLARFGDRASVFVGDMTRFAAVRGGPGRVAHASVDVAFTPINTIRHLSTDRDMLAHFRHVARALRPGGIYVVGVHITAYGLEQASEDVWGGARGGCRVRQVVQYLPAPGGRGPRARHERVVSHLAVRTGGMTREIDSAYVLRSYDVAQWERLIARSALRISAVVDEEGRDLVLAPPGYGVFVLRPRV